MVWTKEIWSHCNSADERLSSTLRGTHTALLPHPHAIAWAPEVLPWNLAAGWSGEMTQAKRLRISLPLPQRRQAAIAL